MLIPSGATTEHRLSALPLDRHRNYRKYSGDRFVSVS
jgi:hypothetical protein